MGTDRSTEFRGPCPCGSGSLVIDFCSPDHSWPVAIPYWYETRVDCAKCSRTYELQQRGRTFVLVERAKLAAQDLKVRELQEKSDSVMKSPEVEDALNKVAYVLGSQRSKAAVFRLLQGAGLIVTTLPAFYREWGGPEEWIHRKVSQCSLGGYLKLAGLALPETEKALRDLQCRIDEARQPVQAICDPVHVVRPDRAEW